MQTVVPTMERLGYLSRRTVGSVYLTAGAAVSLFLIFGVLQTLFAYFIFGRTDDHLYFLSIANFGVDTVPVTGVDLYDFKAKISAYVFYAITAPSRLLGGHELTHLIWTRIITLLGFYAAFEWIASYSTAEESLNSRALSTRRCWFLLIVLIYPGQLAWSASLLRDGVGCAIFFFSMLTWRHKWRIISVALLMVSLSLRPELILMPICILISRCVATRKWFVSNPKIGLLLLCAIASLISFPARYSSSQFSIAAFSDDGAAYPAIESPIDLPGYLLVLLQAVIDPVAIDRSSFPTPFQVMEILFFLITLVVALNRMKVMATSERVISTGALLVLWLFAYFELFVSGFSRHRIALMIVLLATIACSNSNKPMPKHRVRDPMRPFEETW